ncbi:LOW QUALITY PROTEIN: uncharacterized protein EMH_0057590 [Eimeria mitis]|uniref:Uncharacterized protein n=1 Tax=Eimeria mitis TaxID=44415 RepID=U6K261_9EIME|nr:LOW QUALITY PROTEIN: uncharacterized protein EMH_0057590 [Eimeria mitis]CDJ30377.1 hypothetical protein, conserved [Eimeria mitis]
MLHLEVQQLAASLARLHSLRPLRGMGHFAAAAVAFDRFLHAQQMQQTSPPPDAEASPAAGAATARPSGEASSSQLRPLLHTHEPPRGLKEAERRIRFFCSLVTLGATDPSLFSGVAACLPSEAQIYSFTLHQPTHQQQMSNTRAAGTAAAATTACAQQLPLKLLQRLLFACSWVGEWPLVVLGLKILRHRLETLTLQRLLDARSAAACGSRGSRGPEEAAFKTAAAGAAAEEEADERHTAELKNTHGKWRPFKGGPSPRVSSFASSPRSKGDIIQLQDALCGLASAATLWAAVSGFRRQRPEDVALLTFSLIPFWIQAQQDEGAAPVHTQQQVHTIRAAAAAAAAAEHDGTHALHHQQTQRMQDAPNFTALTRSLRGFHTFSSVSGVSPARYVDPSAIEQRERSVPPLLFLLGYNILRLRRSRGNEAFRIVSDAASTATAAAGEAAETATGTGRSVGAAGVATQQHQHQLGTEAEAAAAQLLLRVVAAIEESVSFPEAVNAWYRTGAPGGGPRGPRGEPLKTQRDGDSFFSSATLTRSTGQSRTATAADAASVTATSGAPVAARPAEIRRAGMREVGSFLWSLNRAEGGLGAAETMDADASLSAAAAAAETQLSPFGSSERHAKPLTLQQAARLAARSIRRPGGFADKLALYYLKRAAIFCGSHSVPHSIISITLLPLQSLSGSAAAVGAGAIGAVALAAVVATIEEAQRIASASLLLSLRAFAVVCCRSGIVHAPLLAAECGMLQLFHLLRPLAAVARAGPEASDSESGDRDRLSDPLVSAAGDRGSTSLQEAMAEQQLIDPNKSSSSNSSVFRLLHEADAFLFAVAAALLRLAQNISALPVDSPRTAAQIQLLLLASSDFATLLHAHCCSTGAGAAATEGEKAAAPNPSGVTASAEFRLVMQELLSIFSRLVVRHAPQIQESLALLAAAAETLSLCGRHVTLPSGSKKALEAFASAAIAALRQPPQHHAAQRGAPSSPASPPQRGGGPEELRRLATALEALKFVELK